MKKEFLSVSVLCKSVAKNILPGNGKILSPGNFKGQAKEIKIGCEKYTLGKEKNYQS